MMVISGGSQPKYLGTNDNSEQTPAVKYSRASTSSPIPNPNTTAMEQLWKDITLSNIPHQVFPPPASIHHRRPTADAPFSGLILQDYLAGHFGEHHHPHSPEQLALLPATPSARAEHCASPSIHSNRAVEQAAASAACGGERRQKRMIKNRESAGRSRARKQAYAKELELEIAQLAQENAALKKEHEELKTAMAGQVLSRGKFKRGSSA